MTSLFKSISTKDRAAKLNYLKSIPINERDKFIRMVDDKPFSKMDSNTFIKAVQNIAVRMNRNEEQVNDLIVKTNSEVDREKLEMNDLNRRLKKLYGGKKNTRKNKRKSRRHLGKRVTKMKRYNFHKLK
jgi:hypothetical protein